MTGTVNAPEPDSATTPAPDVCGVGGWSDDPHAVTDSLVRLFRDPRISARIGEHIPFLSGPGSPSRSTATCGSGNCKRVPLMPQG